jgi:aldose sugar dehydrogenase
MMIRTLTAATAGVFLLTTWVIAQAPQTPTLVDKELSVRVAASGFTNPTGIAFLGENDFFVIEKSTGQVKRIRITSSGTQSAVVLDLAVNGTSERGLLGIALHPDFPRNPGVYLYWTCASTAPPDTFFSPVPECPDSPAPGIEHTDLNDATADILKVALLGNRVDRFIWNATLQTLTYDRNLIKLHAFQNDAAPLPANQNDGAQPPAGNHNAGVLRFGPDKKLYIIIGDNGRRGRLQNLADGPTPPSDDDQFGGPEPDRKHLTGSIFRLNDDGSTPQDNPFFQFGQRMGGEEGQNIQKIFAYGIRNSFGMAFDPKGGELWTQENGDDSFDEINRVQPGMNGGWVQIAGPVSRIAQFKDIEVNRAPGNLQQLRWPPANIAATPNQALSRLVLFPGAEYSDPEFSWKFAVAPAAIGFIDGKGLGSQYRDDLIVGAARPTLAGGYLFRFQLTGNRRGIKVDDPRLEDGVADNLDKFEITESETLLFGSGFGVATDIQTGPNGNLYVLSLLNGTLYEIFRPNKDTDDDDDNQGGGGKH